MALNSEFIVVYTFRVLYGRTDGIGRSGRGDCGVISLGRGSFDFVRGFGFFFIF